MKNYFKIIFLALIVLFVNACDQKYIDDISRVEQGDDRSAPVVSITYPNGDLIIPFTDTETDVEFSFEVTDDIEVQTITLSLDGTQLETYNSFLDYRRALRSYMYEDLPVGDHTVQVVATDLAGKSTTTNFEFEVTNKYTAKYDGEIFYMPFEAGLYMDLITETSATVVGTPGFTNGKKGSAYQGAPDSYLTFPAAGLMGDQFSAVMWMKVRLQIPTPEYGNRAGVLVIGPEDTGNADYPVKQNNRKNGFRFFHEGSATAQRFKLNVGNGTADTWVDGGAAADVDPTTGTWVNLAFTISGTKAVVYINGTVVKESDLTGFDWTGCDIMSIMSGAPRFTGWNHLSDVGDLDELRIFNKALTQVEVQAVMND